MRLTFPNGEHAAVLIDQGQVGIGSAIGGGTVVAIPGLAPLHAVFACGRRGRWMTVPEDARVVLNARTVRRLAWIRPGDLVCLGSVQVRIESDAPPPSPAAAGPGVEVPPRHVLRGLNGSWFGCCLPLAASPVVVGRGVVADLRLDAAGVLDAHARFEVVAGRWTVRASAGAPLRVNGHAVSAAVLQSGDQIELGEQRLLLESPGATAHTAPTMSAAAPQAAAPRPAADAPVPPPKDLSGVYLLIAAAAALAAALTAFFVYAPQA